MASTLPLEVYTQENVGRDFLSKLPRFASSLEAQQFRCGEKYPSTKCCVGLFGRTAAGQLEDLTRDATFRAEPAGIVEIEGVGILHPKLAQAQQSGLGARLIAKLFLDLIPHLRQLLVRAQLPARDVGHLFFVGYAQNHFVVVAVLELEERREGAQLVAAQAQILFEDKPAHAFGAGRSG